MILAYILSIAVDTAVGLLLLIFAVLNLLAHDYLSAGLFALILALVVIATIMRFRLVKETY